MAINYIMYLDVECSPQKLQENLTSLSGFRFAEEQFMEYGIAGPGIWGDISWTDPQSQVFAKEDYGLNARVQVFFELDKFDLVAAQASLVRCLSMVLKTQTGDVLLEFNGEMVTMKRCNGAISLSKDSGFWTEQRIQLLGVEASLETVPSPKI